MLSSVDVRDFVSTMPLVQVEDGGHSSCAIGRTRSPLLSIFQVAQAFQRQAVFKVSGRILELAVPPLMDGIDVNLG